MLSAMIAGWSGLSVHCQIMTLCGGRGLSLRPYVLAKLAQGMLSGVVMLLALRFVDPTWLTSATDTMVGKIIDLTASLSLPALPTILSHMGLIWGSFLCIKNAQKGS